MGGGEGGVTQVDSQPIPCPVLKEISRQAPEALNQIFSYNPYL